MAVYTYPNGEVEVSVRLWGEHPIEKQLLARVGLGRFALLNYAGGVTGVFVGKIRENTYTRALDEIKDEEERNLLPIGTTHHVLCLVVTGEFDTSDWALWYGLGSEQPDPNAADPQDRS